MRQSIPSHRLLFTVGVSAIALLAADPVAAQCVNVAGTTWRCAGANDDGQEIYQDDATVLTEDGFSVDGGDAGIDIRGRGPLAYIDEYASSLYGLVGLAIDSTGEDALDQYGSVTVRTGGTVSGARSGVEIASGTDLGNIGSGVTKVTMTGDVSGNIYGITILNRKSATDLELTTGKVTGGYAAITANNTGTGSTKIIANGHVEGTIFDSIRAGNGPGALDFELTATSVTGKDNAIVVDNQGRGETRITTTGAITGTSNVGISATNGATATDLTIDAANVTGGKIGIDALNQGRGSTMITAGDVGNPETATEGTGIRAATGASTISLSIEAGKVSGFEYGIYTAHSGSRGTTIKAGDVSAVDEYGIYATNFASLAPADEFKGDLTIDAGNVSGGYAGIVADNRSDGTTRIKVGDVIATKANGLGILAENQANAIELLMETGKVNGDAAGIYTINTGRGRTSIHAEGDVTGAQAHGIHAVNAGNSTSLAIETVNGVTVTGGKIGIYAENGGRGATSVKATGAVTGTSNVGISATNRATATDLTIDAANVTGGNIGIDVLNQGTGLTRITAGDVGNPETAAGGTGIRANTGPETTSLFIEAGKVSGIDFGIFAAHFGSTGAAIKAGDVSGTSGFGIFATNLANGAPQDEYTGYLTIEVGNVISSSTGISANNQSDGSTSIKAGDVIATNAVSLGIGAVNQTSATDLIIEANRVSAGITGIRANNQGKGETRVIATGAVTGADLYGIAASTGTDATNLSIEAASVAGRTSGILVDYKGKGSVGIFASGGVVGTEMDGIAVSLAPNAAADEQIGNLKIEVAGVSGGQTGISVNNQSDGRTRILASGLVEGKTLEGIAAVAGANATSVEITTAAVTGATNAIRVDNQGTRETSILAQGNVVGTAGIGIDATNAGNSTSLTIETIDGATVTGGEIGIIATNRGTGQTSVTTTGLVVGTQGIGIVALNDERATDLMVSAASTRGGAAGIRVENRGTGLTNVRATDEVAGGLFGILATNGASGKDLTIETVGVTSGGAGILAVNRGTGTTSVTATGHVAGNGTGFEDAGIAAYNAASAGLLKIEAVSVSGGKDGVFAFNEGLGETMIKVGDVTGGDRSGIRSINRGAGQTDIVATGKVASIQAAGIFAQNIGTATDLGVEAADVSGATFGIATENQGLGSTRITTSGIVEGGTAAILAGSGDGQAIAITNAATGVLRNRSGSSADFAVGAIGGPAVLTNRGAIVGAALFGDYDDAFDNAGTWNSIGALSDFGAGADRLTNMLGGTLTGAVAANTAEVTRFANLDELANKGLVTLSDGGIGDRFETSGAATFDRGSTYRLDIGGVGAADMFVANGAVQLDGGKLEVTRAAPLALGGRYTILTGASVAGTFDFTDQMLSAFAGVIDRYTPTSVYLEFAQLRALAAAGATPNQIATAGGVDELPLLSPMKAALVLLPDDVAAQKAFDQLSGEIHPTVRTVLVEDSRLPRNAVLGRLSDGAPGGSLWGQAFGNRGDSDGDRNAAPTSRDTWGFVAGADVALGDKAMIGIAGAWLDTDLDTRARSSSGSAKSIHMLGYAGFRSGGFGIRAGVGYAWADINTRRSVGFAGFSDALAASYDGSVLQGFAELGYRLPLGGGHVEPFANVTAIRAKTDAFAETGGAAALKVDGATEKATLSTAGLRFETAPSAAFSVKGLIGWQHGFGTLAPAGSHAFADSSPFTVFGAAQSRDAGVASIEAGFTLSPRVNVSVAYDGVLGTRSQDHAVKAAVRVAF